MTSTQAAGARLELEARTRPQGSQLSARRQSQEPSFLGVIPLWGGCHWFFPRRAGRLIEVQGFLAKSQQRIFVLARGNRALCGGSVWRHLPLYYRVAPPVRDNAAGTGWGKPKTGTKSAVFLSFSYPYTRHSAHPLAPTKERGWHINPIKSGIIGPVPTEIVTKAHQSGTRTSTSSGTGTGTTIGAGIDATCSTIG
ncbi:hypothetical protein BJV78DRAFT_1353676 [Lactifluus subvellereus]|nr:hypothetical protein BJV78DRAFT_1353676 [Lactifluus subvellereus]